jgi:hypothetical protein
MVIGLKVGMVLLLAIVSILKIIIVVVYVILGKTLLIKIQAGSLYARCILHVCR